MKGHGNKEMIITGVVVSYGFIGSIHTDDGAEDIIDQYHIGRNGVVDIVEKDDGIIVIDLDTGKRITTKEWNQKIEHAIGEEIKIDDKTYHLIETFHLYHVPNPLKIVLVLDPCTFELHTFENDNYV